MTPDEQEYGSLKYVYKPLVFIELRSGRIAIGSGLGSRDLIAVLDGSGDGLIATLKIIKEAASTRCATLAEHRSATSENIVDLGDLEL